MNEKIRDAICDMGYEEAVLFDWPDFDEAIIGVTDDGRAVYDYAAMVKDMMTRDGISEIEAIEFIEYNSLRACAYVEGAPIVIHLLPTEE